MSGNSSSTSFSSLLYHCANTYFAINLIRDILLLPLSIFVLYLGLQRWRQQRSFKTTSHTDIFTYQMAIMELLWVFGTLPYGYAEDYVVWVGTCVIFVAFYGELLIHILTCVERYIAVVHPVAYLKLKNARGVRIRNISIGCVWLVSFGLTSPLFVTDQYSDIVTLCLLAVTILVTTFCSLSVLRALIRPGPGEGGGDKEQVDQSKQRAFQTITAISSTQWLWFLGLLVAAGAAESHLLSSGVSCLVMSCQGFLNLPTCLVMPLLYLHRAGKLTCSFYNNK